MRRPAAAAHQVFERRFNVEHWGWALASWKSDTDIQSTVNRSIPLIA